MDGKVVAGVAESNGHLPSQTTMNHIVPSLPLTGLALPFTTTFPIGSAVIGLRDMAK